MYDDELLGSPELTELEAKYKSIWAGLPEAAAMPRELEAVGGVLAAMVLGGSTGGVAGPEILTRNTLRLQRKTWTTR